jgi:hypothetical protein
MIFLTFDPYNNDEIIIYENKMCFICYEFKLENNETKELNLFYDYIKPCNCKGWTHNICLNKWYEKSNKCPICRSLVYKKYKYNNIILEKTNYFYTFININFNRNINKKNINKVLWFVTIMSLIYYCFDFYRFLLYKNNY